MENDFPTRMAASGGAVQQLFEHVPNLGEAIDGINDKFQGMLVNQAAAKATMVNPAIGLTFGRELIAPENAAASEKQPLHPDYRSEGPGWRRY